MEITAVVVARKGSVRIKNKALLELDGVTLIERKIRQLKVCKNIHRVVFGSNSEEMLTIAEKAGAEPVLRPDYFCDETRATANEMIHNMCSLIKTDVVVWAHCTNPLISPITYDAAVTQFKSNWPNFDSLLSVITLKEHLWNENRQPLNYDPYGLKHVTARDLPPYYMQDGGIFIQRHQDMLDNSYFFGKKPFLFEIPYDEFLDINIHRDYLLARAILSDNSAHNFKI